MGILGIDHVQIAIPRDSEDEARAFYGDLLGLEELPKPEPLRARGGVWFRAGDQELHLGVEEPFTPSRKAHPGLVVRDLDALRTKFRAEGVAYEDDARIQGIDRLFVDDPLGNRLELREQS
jgi:catechol 2,3-dioxygenase-like lactoylglutathione lyase family enzyme